MVGGGSPGRRTRSSNADRGGWPFGGLSSSAVVTGVRVEHHRGATTGSVPGRAVRLGEHHSVLRRSSPCLTPPLRPPTGRRWR